MSAITHFETIERIDLAGPPTPLQRMPRLEAALSTLGPPCPRLYVKREDLTHTAGGGNKIRKLEYLLADAQRHGADTVITAGAVQSNHVRQTAGACAKLGLDCIGVLFRTVANDSEAYERSGNVLLDYFFGADIRVHESTANGAEILERIVSEQHAKGARPYVVPVGGSNAVGCLGYVRVAREIAAQADAEGMAIAHLVTATGSAGTHAGLEAGTRLFMPAACVQGVSVLDPDSARVRTNVAELATASLALATGAKPARVPEDEIILHEGFLGEGYGMPTAEMAAAIRVTARTEGFLLDPVYSGKAMAALVGLVQAGRFAPEETVVFLATGGTPALFAYADVFNGALAEQADS